MFGLRSDVLGSRLETVRGRGKAFWVAVILLAVAVITFVTFPAELDAKFAGICYGICAQQPSHTFTLSGILLPLCARCTGMYGGFAITLAYFLLLRRGKAMNLPPVPILLLVVSFLAVMAIDGINSFINDLRLTPLYLPDNRLRLATGLGTGLAMAVILLPVLNSTMWKKPKDVAVLKGVCELAGALAGMVLFYATVASGFGPLLFPVSLISSAGVLLLISALNLVPVIALAGKEGKITNIAHLLPYWGLALLAAVLELGGMSLLKYWAYSSLGVVLT